MSFEYPVSRRTFMGGLAAALGGIRLPSIEPEPLQGSRDPQQAYDKLAKLGSNENPYGPSRTVLKAMQDVFKYANRYGYPDGGIVEALAEHHGVAPENILLGAGSSEILKVCNDTFLRSHKFIVAPDPTYESVFRFATNTKADAIKVPILEDYRTDIPGIIRAVKNNYRDVGLVYICNPNNPTGLVVPKQEIKLLMDSIPDDVPVLIDEAYHHYVNNPDYAESIPYVREGRNVIVARTFSKISGLAGMRLGYGVAPVELIRRMTLMANGSINVLVKYAGVAALKDVAHDAEVRKRTLALRDRTIAELQSMGYEVMMPTDANFFMVDVGEEVTSIGWQFRERGVIVGRKFPPYDEFLRVSIGTEQEMDRFMAAFKDLFPPLK